MEEHSDDPRLLSLAGSFEWTRGDHVRILGGRHAGSSGTIVNIGDARLLIRHDSDGGRYESGRQFCEPSRQLVLRREAVSLAAYVETVASLLVSSSEHPEAWATILSARVTILRRDRDEALSDPDLIGSYNARTRHLGQPGVMTGVTPAPVPSMPTAEQSRLRFEQPGASQRILYRRGAGPVARAPRSGTGGLHSGPPLAPEARTRSRSRET